MKQLITAALLLVAGALSAQSFEGTLVYKTDFKFKVSKSMAKMGITEQMLRDKMTEDGSWIDSVKTVYKDGDYRNDLYTTPHSWSIYQHQTNKVYAFQEGEADDICTVTDASVDTEFEMTGKMPVIAKLDTIAEINGLKCEVVRVKWKSGFYDYYYNTSILKVDPTLFEKHTFDGFAEFLKISKTLPVQIVKSAPGLATVTLTLMRYKEGKIDGAIFTIPELVDDEELNVIKISNQQVMRIKK